MKRFCAFVAIAALTLILASCGSSNKSNNNTPPPPTVASITVAPSAPSVAVGATQQFTATAKDSSGNSITGVTFTWASSATGVATINSSGLATAVAVGTTQITALAGKVTSAGDMLTVTAAPIVISPASGALPNGTVGAAYSQNITATGGVAPYTFSLDGSSAALPAGLSFSATATAGTISGTPTAASTTSNIIVDVTDSEQPAVTQKATYSLTINNAASACTSGGSESLLNGGYAFLLKGFDASGNPALVVGELTFDGNGIITAGSIDENLNSGVESDALVTSGCYQIGSDQRGLMAVTTANGTATYRFSVGGISGGVASTGHMIDFDASGPFTTGILRKQTGGPFTNASLNGSYAFGGSSLQNSAVCTAPCKFGIAGVISFDGNGGVSGGSEDFNANGVIDGNSANTTWPASPFPIDSGTSYSVSANGRTTLTLSFAGGSSSANDVLYLVSSGEAFFMDTDSQATSSISAGTAFLQSGAPFTANPLSGTYIGYDSGIGLTNAGTPGGGRTDLYLLGPLTAGNSALAGVQYRNNGGTFSTGGLAGSTYSVSSVGRSIIAGGGGHAPLLYLVDGSHFFYLQSNLSVDDGFFELQSTGPFSNSSVSGTFAMGYIDPELASISAVSGVAVFTPGSNSNSVSAILDGNTSGTLVVDDVENGNYSIDSTGLGLLPPGCSTSVTPTTCTNALYVISPTKLVGMDLTGTNTVISTGEQ